ncbi:MAG: BON domain-containing protein [Prosthecobacter sp.]|nr:BON domain-containing protein [Prosthecobacter sp.]HBJ86173.1 hypothetical protein [Verrucomicrobiales bacterium]
MKVISPLIACALLASCLTVQAQIQAQSNPTPGRNVTQLRQAKHFNELIGMEVWNLQNQKLGKLKFFTTDLPNARLVEAVITSGGGFFGLGARLTAVAPRALSTDSNAGVMRLDVSQARFASAPRFDASHMAPATQRERVAEVYRYFGREPWFYLAGQPVVRNAEILQLGHVHRMDRVLGMSIHNPKGGYIAKVSMLMTDLPKGQVVHVVTETGTMGGSKKAILQPQALRFNPSFRSLILDSTAVEFAGVPEFKWLGSGGSFQQEAYVNREVQANKGRNSQQSVQEGRVRSATAMEEGESFRDEQKTQRILQAIQADPALSAHAKGVEVVTLHAQTTLRGQVNTIEGKYRIGEIAKKLGRPENVSNLIEVRPQGSRSR